MRRRFLAVRAAAISAEYGEIRILTVARAGRVLPVPDASIYFATCGSPPIAANFVKGAVFAKCVLPEIPHLEAFYSAKFHNVADRAISVGVVIFTSLCNVSGLLVLLGWS